MSKNRIIGLLTVVVLVLVATHLIGMRSDEQQQSQARVVAATAVFVPARASAPGRATSTNDRVVLYIVREDGSYVAR